MIVVITISPRDYDAVLFDLDGVLTKTAGEPFVPFDIDTDYPRYVGVAAFLESRGIELPLGTPEDGHSGDQGRSLID